MGRVEKLNQKDVCQQCISSFDWNRDKMGLGVLCGLDQTVKVMIATKLALYWGQYINLKIVQITIV